MIQLNARKELSDDELMDLRHYVNTIVTHITDGNKIESEVTGIMGGTVYESESKKQRRLGREEMQPIIDEQKMQLEQKDQQLAQLDNQINELTRRITELEALLAQKAN